MGRAARRLGEDADPGWLNGVHLPRNYVQDNLNIVYLSRSAFNTAGNHQDHRHPKAHPATGWWPSFFAALKIEFVERQHYRTQPPRRSASLDLPLRWESA